MNPLSRVCNGIDAVLEYWNEITEKRHELDYEADGVVAKVNSYALQEQLGEVSRSPRWAIAYKFKAQQAETVVEKIDVQVGRIGSLTPVGKLRPGAARRRDDFEYFAAQPRRDSAQGHPRARHRADRARRRRDSVRHSRHQGRASAREAVRDARAIARNAARRSSTRRARSATSASTRIVRRGCANRFAISRRRDASISKGWATSWSGSWSRRDW